MISILTKYENYNALSDLAFQKTLKPAEAWSLDGSYYNEHQQPHGRAEKSPGLSRAVVHSARQAAAQGAASGRSVSKCRAHAAVHCRGAVTGLTFASTAATPRRASWSELVPWLAAATRVALGAATTTPPPRSYQVVQQSEGGRKQLLYAFVQLHKDCIQK